MSGRLQDRIAIVTGAGCVGPGWGNGRATAVRFAEEGARIFAVDRDLDSVAETIARVKAVGGEIDLNQCDVTDSASVAAMAAACVARFGRIDVLVNNVGGSAPGGPVEMSEEVWDSQVDFNLKSVFLTLKHVLPVMERQKQGSIVNLASTSGIRFTGAAQVGYAATKAGVIQMSRVVAVQYAGKGIRVNTVVPGSIESDQTAGLPEDKKQMIRAAIPMKRIGTVEEVARLSAWLLSDQAPFITGASFVIDGGQLTRI
jgi:NAD(P)-dependent dehydrogenase (short-subunit alcohol dehydrogenase family)